MHNAIRFALLISAIVVWCGLSRAVTADEQPHPGEGEEHTHVEGEDDGADEEGDGHKAGHGHAAGDEHHAEDHHAGPASNHPLYIDPDLGFATFVIFVVLLIVLHKFAWGPILAGLAKREDAIAGDIDAAAVRRQEAEKMLQEYQSQLERAGAEVRAMLEGAKKEAEAMKQSILEEASQAAAAQKDRATSEIEAAKDAAIAEIGDESVNIAFRVASGALHREVKPEDHQQLIAEAGLSSR